MKKKNKDKSKNKSLIIVCILLVIVGLFILFKASTWGIYKSLLSDMDDLEEIMEPFRNGEDISIEKKEMSDRLDFKWFSVGNYFKDFKHDPSVSSDWSETYYQYDGEKKIGVFSVGTFTSLVEASTEDITIYGDGDYTGLDFSNMFFKKFDKFIDENNIKDDVDLLRKASEIDFDKDLGIFSPLSDLRENYSLQLIMSIALPKVDNVYYIYGDYKGYVLELINEEKGNSYYEINLFKDGKRYILSVLSNDFNLDMMKEVIGTIKIK